MQLGSLRLAESFSSCCECGKFAFINASCCCSHYYASNDNLNMEPVDDVNMELAGRVLYQVQNDLLPLAYISSRTSSRRALKLKPSGNYGSVKRTSQGHPLPPTSCLMVLRSGKGEAPVTGPISHPCGENIERRQAKSSHIDEISNKKPITE